MVLEIFSLLSQVHRCHGLSNRGVESLVRINQSYIKFSGLALFSGPGARYLACIRTSPLPSRTNEENVAQAE